MQEYDIKIGEMQTSPAQQAETGSILLAIAQQVALLGKDIYPMVVEYIPGMKYQDKKRLQQMLSPDPSPEQQQQQAQIQQLTAAAQKAKIERDIAESQYKIASTDREKAETARTLAEANQKNMENQLLKKVKVDNVSVSI